MTSTRTGCSTSSIEVRVRMLNVNHGRNKELMERCKPLEEYAWFIGEIRKNWKPRELTAAVRNAVKSMPDNFLIKEFLVIHLKEVEGMLEMDYDAEEIHELFKEEGRKEERLNTERERERADSEKERADKAEERINELEARLRELETAT